MTNQEKQTKTNYILRLDHEFPFEQFGKKWIMYLPGFEGMYAISDDCCVCALDRVCLSTDGRLVNYKAKLLKAYSNIKRIKNDALGSWVYKVVSKNYNHLNNKGYVIFSKMNLMKMISSEAKERTKFEFPFKFGNKIWIGYLQDHNGVVFQNYLVSDDCFVLSAQNYTDTNFQTKYKIRKWTLRDGYEYICINFIAADKTTIQKNIYRSTVLKQVSKILEGMNDE